MIDVHTALFGIQTHIEAIHADPFPMALGYHRFRVGSNWYGSTEPDATALGCSRSAIAERLQRRGQHVYNALGEQEPDALMNAWMVSEYGKDYAPWTPVAGMGREELNDAIHSSHALMAPDGDAAFDDGSQILQFDVGEAVQLVAARLTGEVGWPVAVDLVGIRIPASEFYDCLADWLRQFDIATRQ